MQELREGGYPLEIRMEMLNSGIKGYTKMWKLEFENKGFVNRPGKATLNKRRAQKLVGNQNWFKAKSAKTKSGPNPMVRKIPNSKPRPQTRVEGVLFCPFTPNSALKKELMKIEEFINGQSKVGKIRIVERVGPKLGQILTNKTTWKKEWCGRDCCPPC